MSAVSSERQQGPLWVPAPPWLKELLCQSRLVGCVSLAAESLEVVVGPSPALLNAQL